MLNKRRSLGRPKGTPAATSARKRQTAASAEDTLVENVSQRQIVEAQPTAAAEPMDVDAEQNALDDANISDDEEGGTRIGDIYIPPPIPPHCSTEAKGPRLIIHKIENFNFKSYAGKVVLGPFHHSFTAIIGPNGSGKSNVIDSMLFVFGYRANKIRCKKISTLLHNSAAFPDTQMCSVAVHFHQVEEDGVPIPNTEIVIQRTAYRDNTSFYTVNGKRVVFKEVAKLLKHHGVDLDHNRFLILQGEVESIAMMKPKGQTENETGMLEYLEDIVGTTRYIAPLAKIHQRVEELTSERVEKHNRCKLAERDMKDLEEPYNAAVDYLRLENEYTRTNNLRIQKYISDKNKKLEEITKEHETASNEMKEHDSKAKELESERKEKEAAVREEMAAFDKLRKAKDDIEKKLEKAKSNFTEVQQTMKATNQRRKQNKAQLEKLEEDLVKLRKVPEKNEREIKEAEQKVEKLCKQKSDLENELQKNYALLEKETKPLIEEREKLETELVDLQRHVDEAQSVLKLSEQELKILKQDETTETRKYESMRSGYEESNTKLEEHRAKIQQFEKEGPQFQTEIAAKMQQLELLQKNEQNMRTKLLEKKTEINEKMASMQSTRSNNRVLDFLMRKKNEGVVPGVLGRLGDLGGIDAKYDVAISTCCGRLDNIVVETTDDAEKCILLLRQHDVGRASFIPLENQQHLVNKLQPIKTPENVPRLFDLIRVEDERVRPVFYFALRDTLVANDLDQGTRIAYGAQRYRVVTLNGAVIETSGTMSGGGRSQIRGKMGTKVQTHTKPSGGNTSLLSEQALNELQRSAEELQSQINHNQEEQSRLEREVQILKQNSQKNASELQRLHITIKSLEEQLPRVLKQLQVQKKRMEQTTTDAAKVKQLETEINQKRKNLEASEKDAGKVTSQIDEIKKKIDSIHGDRVKSVQTKINGLATQIKKLTGHISKLKVEVTTSERNVTKTEKQIESLKNDIVKAEEELKQLCEQRKTHDDETVEFSRELDEAVKAIDEAKSGASGMQKEIVALQKKESDMKLKRVEIDQKLQAISAKLTEMREQIPRLRQQLKPLRLHQIPGEAQPPEPLKTYTEEELASYTLQDLQFKQTAQEEQLKEKPNLSCIDEYIQKRDVYLQRVGILEEITAKRNQMRTLHADVHKKRTDEFNAGYHIITRKLKEMYQMITQGGDAELELVDSMDPFQGVTFSVRPPKKTWKNISNLSGGEKTLSSLALVFALHYYKPSPLYFMDEIDAALDFKNISIVAHYIKERTKNAQFIIISLRSNMFELSDYLVGIYKVRDCTDSVTIKNKPPPMPVQPNTQQTQNIQPTEVLTTQNIAMSQTTMMRTTHLMVPTQTANILQTQSNQLNIENNPTTSSAAASQQTQRKPMESLGSVRESTFQPSSESTAITQQTLTSETNSSQKEQS